MASVRFIHELAAIVFMCSFAVRFYWGFVGNSFSSWRAIIPHNREQFHWGREMAKYYLFLRRDPVPVTGHNFLAGATVHDRLDRDGRPDPDRPPPHRRGSWGSRRSRPSSAGGAWCPAGIQTVRMLHYLADVPLRGLRDPPRLLARSSWTTRSAAARCRRIFSGWKNIKPGRTLEALGVAGRGAPEEYAAGRRTRSGADAAGTIR